MVLFDKPSFKLRVIPFEIRSGKENMALDHYLANICTENTTPILRFYGWNPFCLSIGYHQNKNLIDYAALNNVGYDWVRRPTGGRAIFHSDELTYSVIFPRTLFAPQPLYQFIHDILERALNDLGYPVEKKLVRSKIPMLINENQDFACFTRSAYSEIQCKDKKLVGSAQRLYQKAILQHGSIMIGASHKRLVDFVKADKQHKKKIKNELDRKTICLSEIKDISVNPDTIVRYILDSLVAYKNIHCYHKAINNSELSQTGLFVKRQMERPAVVHKEDIELY